MASSCFQSCIAPQRVPNTAKRMKRAIIRGLVQSYFVPPHCKVRSNEITAGMNVTMPRGSICLTLLRRPGSTFRLFFESLKNIVINSPVIAPRGKLSQKHHRQLARSVSSPPSLFLSAFDPLFSCSTLVLHWPCDSCNPAGTPYDSEIQCTPM